MHRPGGPGAGQAVGARRVFRIRQLWPLSLAEWRHHPWRHATALLAVALGVALAASVQMINASALAEFAQAVRSVNGEPDAVLAADQRDGFDDHWFAVLARHEAVLVASPVLELEVAARRDATQPARPLKLLGVDALRVGAVAPGLQPQPTPPAPRASGPGAAARSKGDARTQDASAPRPRTEVWAMLAPDTVYLSDPLRVALGLQTGQTIELSTRDGWQRFEVAGRVDAEGQALAVIDIAAAQTRFDRAGRLSRIDLRLASGAERERFQAELAWPGVSGPPGSLPPGLHWARADDAVQRMSNLSRAYRVNLGVLAGVALLVGGFLVYSVVSLSVAQRTPQLALLGVLGLAAADRRALVLAESALLGAAGSLLGLAAGAGLAALALQLLGGDLGGGYFAGVAPRLHWPAGALAACAGLGTAAAVAGAWWPARRAEALAPAQALKGLGGVSDGATAHPWAGWAPGLGLLGVGGLLAWPRRCPGCRWPRMPRWACCWPAACCWCRRWSRPCSPSAGAPAPRWPC